MGQSFILFNIDKRQAFNMCCKFGECWHDTTMPALVFMLAPAHAETPEDPLAHLQANKDTLRKKDSFPTKAGLHSLPIEIHEIIFEHLHEYYQVYSLCLTNTYFWIVGISRLRKLFIPEATRKQNLWAGDRIICLGGYAQDLPENVCTSEELADIKSEDDNDDAHEFILQDELWNWTDQIPNQSYFSALHFHLQDFFEDEIGYIAREKRRYQDVYHWSRVYTASIYWQANEHVPYVLRNLTKKVYVRADEFALSPDDINGFRLKKLSFGHLVYSKIAWSSDDSMCMAYSEIGNLHRGDWAGNRFDVVRMDQCYLEGWSNVSKEAQKDLIKIWETEEGRHWEQSVWDCQWYQDIPPYPY